MEQKVFLCIHIQIASAIMHQFSAYYNSYMQMFYSILEVGFKRKQKHFLMMFALSLCVWIICLSSQRLHHVSILNPKWEGLPEPPVGLSGRGFLPLLTRAGFQVSNKPRTGKYPFRRPQKSRSVLIWCVFISQAGGLEAGE